MVVADDTGYVTPGVDVLGLLANNNFYIASWLPANSNLNWSAASLAENGSWGQPSGITAGYLGTMYHEGSIAQLQMGNGMTQFDYRYYNYDPNLQYLQPPVVPDAAEQLPGAALPRPAEHELAQLSRPVRGPARARRPAERGGRSPGGSIVMSGSARSSQRGIHHERVTQQRQERGHERHPHQQRIREDRDAEQQPELLRHAVRARAGTRRTPTT